MANSKLKEWLVKNGSEGLEGFTGGTIGKIFGAAAIVELATAENKLKAIGKLLKDILLFKPMLAAMGATAFSGMTKAVRSLVKDTGSLDAALKKLSKIQGLEKTFAPFVGGASAAKMKVAELTAFAARFNKTLEETGEASRSLTIMTRGAFSGADALRVVGDAAAGTNNDMIQLADTTGELFAQLRSGGSIDNTASKLADMGVISQETASKMIELNAAGATSATIFNVATDAMREYAGSMDKSKESIAGVTSGYEAAVAELQEKFASPFVADDIKNTKNMTEAMKALAPSVARLGAFYNVLTGGLSTAKTSLAQFAATCGPLRIIIEGLGYAIGLVVTAFGVWGGIALGGWFLTIIPVCRTLGVEITLLAERIALLIPASLGAGNAIIGFGGALSKIVPIAATAGATLAVALSWLSALAIVATVIVGVVGAIQKEEQALKDLKKAHDETTSAMQKQIAAMKTLQDQSDALSKSLQNEKDAQEELNKAILEGAGTFGGDRRIVLAQEALNAAKKQTQEVLDKPRNQLAPSDEQMAQARAKVQRDKMLEEQSFQQQMETASPEEKIRLMTEKKKKLEARDAEAQYGIKDKLAIDSIKRDADNKLKAATSERDEAGAQLAMIEKEFGEEMKKPKNARSASKEEAYNRSYPVASARKQVADQKYEEASYNALNVGYYANGSTGIERELRSLAIGDTRGILKKNETEEEAKARLTLALEKARANEESSLSGETGAQVKDLEERIRFAKAELDLSIAMADIEKQRDGMKEMGYARTQKEIALQMKALDAQIAFEKSRSSVDQAKVSDLEGQKTALQTQKENAAAEMQRNMISIQNESARQKALLTGDSKKVQTIDDYSKFEGFRSAREQAGMSPEDAIAAAREMALGSVALDGLEGGAAMRSSVAATDLARVGGGGNVAAGNDMINIAKRQADLLQSIKENTEKETSAKKGTPIK